MYTTLFPFALCSLLLSFCPICPLLLTWNPPCCDRIRPPCPQVARKLTHPFPSPGSYTPHSKIPTPRSFPTPNIHSLGQQCEPSSPGRAHVHLTQALCCSPCRASLGSGTGFPVWEGGRSANSRFFSFTLSAFFCRAFALFLWLRACEGESTKKAPAPTSAK